MRDADLALDLGVLREHQRAGLAVGRNHVAAHASVHAQAPGEGDIALDGGARADQALDGILGLVTAAEHGVLLRKR
ncbi:hypothetical protein D3C83_145100 [compost metagenome]